MVYSLSVQIGFKFNDQFFFKLFQIVRNQLRNGSAHKLFHDKEIIIRLKAKRWFPYSPK